VLHFYVYTSKNGQLWVYIVTVQVEVEQRWVLHCTRIRQYWIEFSNALKTDNVELSSRLCKKPTMLGWVLLSTKKRQCWVELSNVLKNDNVTQVEFFVVPKNDNVGLSSPLSYNMTMLGWILCCSKIWPCWVEFSAVPQYDNAGLISLLLQNIKTQSWVPCLSTIQCWVEFSAVPQYQGAGLSSPL